MRVDLAMGCGSCQEECSDLTLPSFNVTSVACHMGVHHLLGVVNLSVSVHLRVRVTVCLCVYVLMATVESGHVVRVGVQVRQSQSARAHYRAHRTNEL